MTDRPTTPEEVQALVKANPRCLPRAGSTKPALSTPREGVTALDLSGLSGVLEYDPGEFTFTALAGTPVSDVRALLAEHGQQMPFDPPLAERGATLGGTVAAGLSGPGRYRYGGVRDFILGVRFVDGEGQLVRGGGKVVKNAAGFDLPKLMVGSLGQLGVLVELTFKVFPRPEAYATLRHEARGLGEALDVIAKLYASPLDIEAFDFMPDTYTRGASAVYVRLGGLASALPARLQRLSELIGGGDIIEGNDDAALWQDVREFAWVPGDAALVKVPLTPARISALEAALQKTSVVRRYSAGGQVVWLAWREPISNLQSLLDQQKLSGLVIWGGAQPLTQLLIGVRTGAAFFRRVKSALDPAKRFVEV
jgi:glycolate oxidase FAD binding subunit